MAASVFRQYQRLRTEPLKGEAVFLKHPTASDVVLEDSSSYPSRIHVRHRVVFNDRVHGGSHNAAAMVGRGEEVFQALVMMARYPSEQLHHKVGLATRPWAL